MNKNKIAILDDEDSSEDTSFSYESLQNLSIDNWLDSGYSLSVPSRDVYFDDFQGTSFNF